MTNHYASGIIIATQISNPPLAMSLAFASHFVCDALPHFGFAPGEFDAKERARRIFRLGLIDGVFSFALFLSVFLFGVSFWVMFIAGFAVLPDTAWMYRFFIKEKMGRVPPTPMNSLNKFHSWVQWGERPWGWVLEVLYFVIFVTIIIAILNS